MYKRLWSECLSQGGEDQEVHHHAAQDADWPGPDEHEGHLPPGDGILLVNVIHLIIIQNKVQIPF